MVAVQIDHAAYQERVKRMTSAELLYTIKDAGEASEANPTGGKAGYYADEVHYCAMELRRRGTSNTCRDDSATLTRSRNTHRKGRPHLIVTMLSPFTDERYDRFLDMRTDAGADLRRGNAAPIADVDGKLQYISYAPV